MITSTSNPEIKYVRRLLANARFRVQQQAFIIEGVRWLCELGRHSQVAKLVLATPEWLQNPAHGAQAANLPGPLKIVSEQVMAHVTDTVTPAGVLAVVPFIESPFPDRPTLLLILDRVGNPGNLGTMLRTSSAAGVDGVVLSPGCVDIYNPKVVRSAMGAHLHLPFRKASWNDIDSLTTEIATWVADATGGTPYYAVDWRRPSALVIGSEAHGPGAEIQARFRSRVAIPMKETSESINAAIAAGIILFEASRQRAELS